MNFLPSLVLTCLLIGHARAQCQEYCKGSCCYFTNPAAECGECSSDYSCHPGAECYDQEAEVDAPPVREGCHEKLCQTTCCGFSEPSNECSECDETYTCNPTAKCYNKDDPEWEAKWGDNAQAQPSKHAHTPAKKKHAHTPAAKKHQHTPTKKSDAKPAAEGASSAPAKGSGEIYLLDAEELETGEQVKLEKYAGKVMLIVNTATGCGFADETFTKLNELFSKYEERGLAIAGFPSNDFDQEPGSIDDIVSHATRKGAEFDLYRKVSVTGAKAHPLFKFLTAGGDPIRWNYEVFLVSRTGELLQRWPSGGPITSAAALKKIEAALDAAVQVATKDEL